MRAAAKLIAGIAIALGSPVAASAAVTGFHSHYDSYDDYHGDTCGRFKSYCDDDDFKNPPSYSLNLNLDQVSFDPEDNDHKHHRKHDTSDPIILTTTLTTESYKTSDSSDCDPPPCDPDPCDTPKAPIPGAALLFASGLAALGYSGRKLKKRAPTDSSPRA